MKTVSAAFLAAQSKNHIKYFFEINLYRRYWDAGSSTYLWETEPMDIKPYVVSKSNLTWQLDTEGLNVWKTSNVQLELKNSIGEWNEDGENSFFGSDYVRFKSKIEIKIGYILADGTTESVYNFTGIIVNDLTNNYLRRTIVINLSGKEELLTLTSAEDICQTVVGETLGTGAYTKKFYTSSTYVLSVLKVYKNGVEISTSDYTVSELYNTELGARITLDTAPIATDVITADYIYGNNQLTEAEQLGNGTLEANFETANKGVGFIDAVYIDGAKLTEEIDYSTENLSSKDNYGKIVFPYGVGIGQVITCDYRYWYLDTPMTTLIGYLLDAVGFTSGERTIGTIDIGELVKYKIWDTRPDFTGMDSLSRNISLDTLGEVEVVNENIVLDVNENIGATITGSYPSQSAAVTPASFDFVNKYDAAALPASSTPAWTKAGSGSESVGSGILAIGGHWGGGDNRIINYAIYGNYPIHFKCRFKLKASGVTAGSTFKWTVGTQTSYIRYDGYGNWNWNWNFNVISTLPFTGDEWAGYHIFEMKVMNSVRYFLYDGTVVYSEAYATHNFSKQMGIEEATGTLTMEGWLDYEYDGAEEPWAQLTSEKIDFGIATNKFGTILRTATDPGDGSTLKIYTQVSTTPDFSSGNDAWYEVVFSGNVGTINAATQTKRYLRWRAIFLPAAVTSPVLTKIYMPGHIYDKLDCGSNWSVYNGFFSLFQNNNGLIKIYTSTSPDDGTWEAETEVVDSAIASTEARYIRFRTVLYFTATGTTPKLYKEYFTYKLTSLNVAMANFTGMTIQDVLVDFSKLLDYEIGVGSDGKYFFRKKNIDMTIDLELSDRTNIIAIDNDSAGWARIYNKITFTLGRFKSIMSSITEAEVEPHSITKYGLRILDLNSSAINIDDDLDLSGSLVKIYYDKYNLPKRELRLLCKMLPQLELSDTVRLEYGMPFTYWRLGDPTRHFKGLDTFFFSKNTKAGYFTSDLTANVVGLELDINKFTAYVSVREI